MEFGTGYYSIDNRGYYLSADFEKSNTGVILRLIDWEFLEFDKDKESITRYSGGKNISGYSIRCIKN